MTPWAELLRNEDRRSRERALLVRYPIWAIKIDLSEEPLELSFDSAEQYGLEPQDLVSDDRSACQAFGEGQRGSVGALRVPSAALPGTLNLVILEPAVVTFYEAAPAGPEDLPTSMIEQGGRCPEGLWDFVHLKGSSTPHPGYQAWELGDDYEFQEPMVNAATLAP